VAGQQILTSYLRPSSRPRRRYQDSRPWGADAVGKVTGRRVDRIEFTPGERAGRWRSPGAGRTLVSAMGAGARNMAFSTLAFTVVSSDMMQPASQGMVRIFEGTAAKLEHTERTGKSGTLKSRVLM